MKKMKKILAFVMAMAMVLGMSVTALADPAPTQMPSATVTVKNVAINLVPKVGGQEGETEDTVKVTAYQVIKYDLKGEYIRLKDGNPSNMEAPTAEEMWALAKEIASDQAKEENQRTYKEVSLTKSDAAEGATTTNYTATLDAGMWLILIKGAGDTIYNPMVASVVVGPDKTTGGTVDASGKFKPGNQELYAKSSTPELEKTTTDSTFEINDDINFVVNAQIPDYGSNYETVMFIITDELSGGLEYDKENVTVTIKAAKTDTTGTVLTGGDAPQVTPVFSENDTKMKIEIPSNIVLANTTKYVVVEYKAKLTDVAKAGLDDAVNETKNNVKVEYSNNPLNSDEKATKETETKQYTFGLNALLNGTDITKNFIKVEKDKVEEGEEQTYTALGGAEFELVKKNAEGEYVKITNIANDTTDGNGVASFVGLEGNVEYYLHEVSAPEGYTVEDRYVKVYIEPTITNGILESYKITVGEASDTLGGEHAMTYQWNDTTKVSTEPDVKNPYNFVNTKLASLPSTGGIGTTIFTIGGCAIMIVAAGLFFASRRKSAK